MKRVYYKIFLSALCSVIMLGCKEHKQLDDENIYIKSIEGIWEYEFGIVKTYDFNNQLTKIDTIRFIDLLGQPMTIFEQFTSNYKYYRFRNTMDDTLNSATFSITGDILTINILNQEYQRKILSVDKLKLELFHKNDSVIPTRSITDHYKKMK